jgi:hypothetical protein
MGVGDPTTPLPSIPRGTTLADVIAAAIRRHAAATNGTDLAEFDTDRILRLHQYNLFPNCSFLITADTLSALVARPGPDPDSAELLIFVFRRAVPGAPYTRPTDVRVAFDELDLGFVLNQDAAVLAGMQRGLHQPGTIDIVLSQEEKRVVNTHRNLEHYLGIGPRD